MIKECRWLYRLDDDYTWDASHIFPYVDFSSPWLNIDNGIITVKKGYAWDGCSYKVVIADLWVIGTPDGRQQYGKPITYRASLLHDALTQYRHHIGITHQQAAAVFDGALKEARFFWRPVYVWMVKAFGQKDFKGNE